MPIFEANFQLLHKKALLSPHPNIDGHLCLPLLTEILVCYTPIFLFVKPTFQEEIQIVK